MASVPPHLTLNIPFKKVVLPERVKCGGTEGEIVVAHGGQKRKKLICGSEGEMPSPAPCRVDDGLDIKERIEQGLIFFCAIFVYTSGTASTVC